MKVRVFYKLTGEVIVKHFIWWLKKADETDKEFMDRIDTKHPYYLPYDDMDVTELPTDRKYRNAWRGSKGQPIEIDAAKKTEIDDNIAIEENKERLLKKFLKEELVKEGKL